MTNDQKNTRKRFRVVHDEKGRIAEIIATTIPGEAIPQVQAAETLTKREPKTLEDAHKKKRVSMTEFEINEISAVDRPAQSHALASIIKRDNNSPKQTETTMETFDELVTKHAALRKRGRLDAMSFCRKKYPNAYQKLQLDEDRRQTQRRIESAKPPSNLEKQAINARAQFQGAVDTLMAANPRMTKTVASAEIRKRQPQLFASAYR